MYDKILKFVKAMIEFFLHPVNEELFSSTLKLYHEIKKRKDHNHTLYSDLTDALYQSAGQTIHRDDINKIIANIDKIALNKWSSHILE